MDAIKTFLATFVEYAVVISSAGISDAANVLVLDFASDPIFSTVYNVMKTVSQSIIVPVAVDIMLVIFMIEFIQLTIKFEEFRIEFFFKMLLKFLIAKYALDVSFEIIQEIYQAGAGMIAGAVAHNNANNVLGIAGTAISAMMTKLTWYEAIGFMGTLIPVLLALVVIPLLIKVMAYARIVQVMMYMTVFPLPCAFLGLGHSQITKNFMLEFAGIVLQGLVMILCIIFYNSLISGLYLRWVSTHNVLTMNGTEVIISSCVDLSLSMLFASVILIVSIVGSGSFAKSILKG